MISVKPMYNRQYLAVETQTEDTFNLNSHLVFMHFCFVLWHQKMAKAPVRFMPL